MEIVLSQIKYDGLVNSSIFLNPKRCNLIAFSLFHTFCLHIKLSQRDRNAFRLFILFFILLSPLDIINEI